jgi:hypothetical protein
MMSFWLFLEFKSMEDLLVHLEVPSELELEVDYYGFTWIASTTPTNNFITKDATNNGFY